MTDLEIKERKDRKDRFMELVDALIQRLEDVPRMDIRDYIAALSLIDRVMAREKDDDTDRGSQVRKYAASAFQAPNGGGRRTSAAGHSFEPAEPVDEPGAGEPDDRGPDERDDDDHPDL